MNSETEIDKKNIYIVRRYQHEEAINTKTFNDYYLNREGEDLKNTM